MTFKLPKEATGQQIEMYNKNYELYLLAIKNMNRYGSIIGMCSSLGSQDVALTHDENRYDENRFLSVYPYDYQWYRLAYGESFSDTVTDT